MQKCVIDGNELREMYLSAAASLTNHREYVDSLNVFPVPDGDTGTNMSQTIAAAVKEMQSKPAYSVGDVANIVARGALKGARGNSGVILSQILRGFASAIEGKEEIDCASLVEMFRQGALTATKAVLKPKEGTILTVIRVISEDIAKVDHSNNDLVELFGQAVKIGDAILKRTPDMLPVLKQAGVVDSGGMGLMVVLKGMYACLSGEPVDAGQSAGGEVQSFDDYVDDHTALSVDEIKFGYCTEFIVSHPRENMQQSEVERLRRRLEKIGDCVIVVSDMSVVKVHVHTNEPGKAIQMALELGELDNLKIDNMWEEAREREALKKQQPPQENKEYGIVAVSLGQGFTEIFKEIGVDVVVDGGQTMNPSIENLFNAIEQTNADNVFILPDNTNIILAAQQAVSLTARNVIVLPTKSVPMGISAALAFNPEADVETNKEDMDAAAQNVHTGSITYSVRESSINDNDIHTGDIMGMIDNRIEVTGSDVHQVAKDTAVKMISEETALVTVYYGEDVNEDDAQQLVDELTEMYPDCDITLQYGGQPLYYYYIAVE